MGHLLLRGYSMLLRLALAEGACCVDRRRSRPPSARASPSALLALAFHLPALGVHHWTAFSIHHATTPGGQSYQVPDCPPRPLPCNGCVPQVYHTAVVELPGLNRVSHKTRKSERPDDPKWDQTFTFNVPLSRLNPSKVVCVP